MEKYRLKNSLKRSYFAFSLVELMISLITISCIVAAFTPVITKKLKKQDIAISIAQSSEIISPCKPDPSNPSKFIQSTNENEDCQLCTSSKCIKCQKECGNGYYLDSNACDCISCDKFKGEGENGVCEKCNKDGCTLCKTTTGTWSRGYTIGTSGDNKGKCVKCNGADLPSNGTNQCAVPCAASGAYYCDGNKLVSCIDRYGKECYSCDKNYCKYCGTVYRLSYDRKRCIRCSASNCLDCSSCNGKPDDTCQECATCRVWAYKYNGKCVNCKEVHGSQGDSNCFYCSDDGKCTTCDPGYHLTSYGKCERNSLENCLVWKDNASKEECEQCMGGYYVSDGKCSTCSEKFGSDCVLCDATKCLSCKIPLRLVSSKASTKTPCETFGGFSCNDSNFMRVGNLCITRKNMGDGSPLAIPPNAKVTVVNVDETCYTFSELCCWKGKTASSCTSTWGNYSGCNRTLCSSFAGAEICSKFNYLGLKWRLPTQAEANLFTQYSSKLGSNGLQICDQSGDVIIEKCGGIENPSGCVGAQYGCHGFQISNNQSSPTTSHLIPQNGILTSNGYGSRDGSSTRCVTDLTGTEFE